MKILVTCPPMLGMIESFNDKFEKYNMKVDAPKVKQTMSEKELISILPNYDGWIIGDDPASRQVFEAGRSGKLKAAVKWGIGVDNVDFQSCKNLGIPICNTPNMFGNEVADIAIGYVIALARETFQTHIGIINGDWPKPIGISLAEKKVALIGLGDVGSNVARRLISMGMHVTAYDPVAKTPNDLENKIYRKEWPIKIELADFIVITCALTKTSKHMLNEKIFSLTKKGVRIVNVGRGPVIDEKSLEEALNQGKVYSAALDVFEDEPLPLSSRLRENQKCIFGSHNASNTKDAVLKTSNLAIDMLKDFLV